MREPARPALPFLLAIGAALAAPACLAQDAAALRQADTAEAEPATLAPVAATEDGEPRSAFGRVMSIMISALKQESVEPESLAPAMHGNATGRGTSAAAPVRTIQVGAAFRLDQPTVAAESAPAPGPGAD